MMELENNQEQKSNIIAILSCNLCKDIFKRPVTLKCGHTFCQVCLYKFIKQTNRKQQENDTDENKQTISVAFCPICNRIIWKSIRNMRHNIMINNLIQKYNLKPQIDHQNIILDEIQSNHKILLDCEQPSCFPLPDAFTEIYFNTSFLEDISEQSESQSIAITWPSFKKGFALCGFLSKIEQVQKINTCENKYKAIFFGFKFVKIVIQKDLYLNLNQDNYINLMFLGGQKIQSLIKLCKIQTKVITNICQINDFQLFFSFYDKIKQLEFLRQIQYQIDRNILYNRNDPSRMIYCCLKILQIDKKQKEQIVFLWDDKLRINAINNWLNQHQNCLLKEIFTIQVLGSLPTTIILIILAIIYASSLLSD